MFEKIDIIKGIHPGLLVDRELNKRKIRKTQFADTIDEHPQTLTAITKGKRKMNIPLSRKIEKAFNWECGFLMTLQVYHDIRMHERTSMSLTPDLTIIRPVLFWDTDFSKIDWLKHKKAVIERVNERGNQQEKAEINRFYDQL